MTDDTRDIAVEARTDIKQIKEMLRGHIEDTKEHRESQNARLTALEGVVLQAKGAKVLATGLVATVTTVGLGTVAKFMGFIR